jgi:spore coat polysaccharide biosynthesis predicted glycosyltransferase SpsG
MKIIFRCDGDSGKLAGLGHVYRQIDIYKAIKIQYPKLKFIFLMKSFKEGISLVKRSTKAEIIIFDNNLILNFTKFFDKNDLFILDTNSKNKEILNCLRKNFFKKIILFEHVHIKNLPRSIIINGIYFAKKKIFSKKKIKIYQGVKYLVLRDQFKNNKNKFFRNNNLKKVLVTSGGGDYKNFILKILRIINLKNFDITVILGLGIKKNIYRHLKSKINNHSNIKIKYNVKNMAELMSKSDLNIVTGGTVMFESLCTTTTTAVIQTYHHQSYAIKYFKSKEAIEYCGCINKLNYKKINLLLKRLNDGKLNKKIKPFVDANGKQRVLEIIKRNFLAK